MARSQPTAGRAAAEGAADCVVAELTYTLKKPERLVYRIADMGDDEDSPEYHKWYDTHEATIRDARSLAPNLSLDREGFVLRRSQTRVRDFFDDAELRTVYDAETADLVKEATGADDVLVFDHTIRISSSDLRRERKVREIVNLVHVDYTLTSGRQRVRDLLSDGDPRKDAAGRFAIVNLWRSIAGRILSSPLAMCDARSADMADMVAAELDYGDRTGEIFNVAYNPAHKWWYFPAMEADEVILFKNYDSAEDGRARFAPHTAFDDPTTPPGAPPRQSIETRALAFFSDPAGD